MKNGTRMHVAAVEILPRFQTDSLGLSFPSLCTENTFIYRMEAPSVHISSALIHRRSLVLNLSFSKIKPYCQTPYFLELFIEF